MRIVLASSSPRRKELMKMLDLPFEIIVKDHEEILDEKLNNYDKCLNIAYQKAKNVFDDITGDVIVIGCDTIVINNGEIYGKPKDFDEAYHMLTRLSNNVHEVVSGVSMIIRHGDNIKVLKEYNKSLVYVDKIDENDIINYINKCQPYDKAGAYAIQEDFGKYISKIDGDYYSIMGLPVNLIYNMLKKIS